MNLLVQERKDVPVQVGDTLFNPMNSISYWLLKSEPSVFSLDDLVRSRKQTVRWDGVRNYQARNFLRDQMRPGDLAFFYHSSCKLPGIVGIVEIVRSGYPDPTAWDKESPYFDPKSLPARPRWFAVDVKLVSRFTRTIALSELRCYPELAGMPLLKRGNRLSVLPIDPKQWNFILSLVPDTSLPTLS